MTGAQLIEKMISINAGERYVSTSQINDNIHRSMELVSSYNKKLIIESNQGLTIEDIRAKIVEVTSTNNLRMVIIDHLHIIKRPGKNEVTEMTYIANALKDMAKKYNVAFLVLSQVNKSDGNYGPKKVNVEQVPGFPMMGMNKVSQQSNELTLGSIKGSSAITDNSALVIAIWEDQNIKAKGAKIIDFAVLKNRYGASGKKYLLSFYGERSSFYDYGKKEEK